MSWTRYLCCTMSSFVVMFWLVNRKSKFGNLQLLCAYIQPRNILAVSFCCVLHNSKPKFPGDFTSSAACGFLVQYRASISNGSSVVQEIVLKQSCDESENANFCLFLVLKTCWRRGGRGVQKSQKCDDVIYEWSLCSRIVLP